MSVAMLFDNIARIARHEANARPIAAIGEVTNVYTAPGAPADHSVTVKLRESGLTIPRVPIAVGVLGFAAIPDVGDLVIVVFAEGDYHSPVVVGRLYRDDFEPPEHATGQVVLRLPSGGDEPQLQLEAGGDPALIKITLPDDVVIQIEKGKTLWQAGEVSVSLEAGGGGRIEIKAGGTAITLKKDGDMAIKSAGNLKIEANEIDLSGSGKVKIRGGMVEVN
jgi:phage baseplate assembly protein gpV